MATLRDMSKWNKECSNVYRQDNAYYKNPDAVSNVIKYITRSRYNENRLKELICYGGSGVHLGNPMEMINDFLTVQNFYQINKRGGRRLLHEVYSLTDEDFRNLNYDYALVNLVGREISAFYFASGFQTIYAVHADPEKHVHIHVVVNYVNFRNGKKYHSGGEDFKNKLEIYEKCFMKIKNIAYFKRKQMMITSPVYFFESKPEKYVMR